MSTHPGSQIGFLDGTQEIIDSALGNPAGGYTSITAANQLNVQKLSAAEVRCVVKSLWQRMAVNWVEAGCQSRGKVNWRWQLSPLTASSLPLSTTQSEIILQRKVAGFSSERWSNETPTGSGLSGGSRGDPGGLDLAYWKNPDVYMIELKTGSNTPVSAAFQVVRYGLALVLARLVEESVSIISKAAAPSELSNPWREARNAHLCVLAPTAYYQRWPGLRSFEEDLKGAVGQFGSRRGLPMSFRFRCFESAETLRNEQDVIACLHAERCVFQE
jgi:hypothetical protein